MNQKDSLKSEISKPFSQNARMYTEIAKIIGERAGAESKTTHIYRKYIAKRLADYFEKEQKTQAFEVYRKMIQHTMKIEKERGRTDPLRNELMYWCAELEKTEEINSKFNKKQFLKGCGLK